MDASDNLTQNWQDLDVTREELKLITENLKNEQFRQLLAEYAKEVNDPENKKLYEQEFALLEKQRGVDVTFVKPQPGYVLKTSVNGDRKCFVNVSQSEIVEKPTSEPSFDNGKRGLKWSIPYTLTPPRDDLDRKNARCVVVDVVFHPDTLHLAHKNAQFREMVNKLALDGVENHFKMKLDLKNVKFPKMTYKGHYQPTVIRKPSEKSESCNSETEVDSEIYQKLILNYDESRKKQSNMYAEKVSRPKPTVKYFNNLDSQSSEEENYSKPKYIIKYQSYVDLEEYTFHKDAKMFATVPKSLLITIDLPLLRSAEDATLDVQEQLLTLKSEKPAKYYLHLLLPYRTDPDHGNAKFDVTRRKLNVTLPVIRSLVYPEDSGVDSDNGSPIHEMVDNLKLNSSDENNIISISDDATTNLAVEKELMQDTISILDPNIKYVLPVFFCNIFENILAVTINVKNVESGSISHRILKDNSGVQVVLKSVGAGFFPSYYSLCMKIGENIVDPETLTVEPWDNNVVLTVTLRSTDSLSEYSVGLDEHLMETKYFSNIEIINNKFNETEEPIEKSQEENIIINTDSCPFDSEDEEEPFANEEVLLRQQEMKRNLIKSRSISESSGDELPSISGRHKGILKSRSVSESSVDDGITIVPSVHFNYDSAQEINSEPDYANLKKTVRFNTVVSTQLYRSNSSILGRRKKNQRKLRNKRRAQERRMSESENSETEERDKYKIQPKTQKNSTD